MAEHTQNIHETQEMGEAMVNVVNDMAMDTAADVKNGKDHLRMWNPVQDARSPSEDEFSVKHSILHAILSYLLEY